MNGQQRRMRGVVSAIAGMVFCAGSAGAETASPSTNPEFDRKVDETLARLRPVSTNWMAEKEAETDAVAETDGAVDTGTSASGVTVAKPSVPETAAPSIEAPATAAETEVMVAEPPPTRSGPDPRWIAEQNAASAKLRRQQLSGIESGGGRTEDTP